ncbi:MAG: aminotransferase class IV [Solirubrobacterales bacterium]
MAHEPGAAKRPRPDPRQGVFETTLVVAGAPVELDAHLDRLTASTRALFGQDPPDRARELVLRESAGVELGRVRATVAPHGDELRASAIVAGVYPGDVFPRGESAAALSTIVVDRGLGGHKWADRAMLERAEALGPTGTVPLLVREDGTVLEASRANVFLAREGVLLTPPLAAGVLPGITRAAAIELARSEGVEVREQPIYRDDLVGADEVFLTGSVRGVEPVRAIDADPIPCPETAARPLAAELRRRWLDGACR